MGSLARRAVREESWDSLHYSDASNGSSRAEESTEGDGDVEGSSALLTVGDVQRVMHPLQATADRVGKQVERFAENLDRLSPRNKRRSRRDCHHVLPLVYEYERIASVTVDRLRKVHQPEREAKLSRSRRRRSRNSSGRSTPIPIHEDENEDGMFQTTPQDLQNWEEERQTWRLLGLMLEVEYPTAEHLPTTTWHDERFSRPSKDAPIHQYSTEHDLWEKFLAEHDSAWEKNVVVEWLKMSAESSSPAIDILVKDVEMKADRGSGIWSHGWLHTKEMIKDVKRLRSWPLPLDPNSPGIETALVSADGTPLVTQIDPDAFSRQGRSLQTEDVWWERATWLACWEMLRRGRSWESIRERCQDRVEGWKALAMRGDPRANIMGEWQSRALWRNICARAAKHGGIDPYENAIYGALSGDLSSVERVIRNCDDYLFAYYNSDLLQSFDLYVQTRFPNRISESLRIRMSVSEDSAMKDILGMSAASIIGTMQEVESLKIEAKNPMKMLQTSLISKQFGRFVNTHGTKLAQTANKHTKSKLMEDMRADFLDIGLTADITIEDYDLLRILTHIIFIFQEFEPITYESYAAENIIVAYVDFLGKAGKLQLLPLYASRLSDQRSIECMGRQLPFVTEAPEREMTMRLMKQYGLDVQRVLQSQLLMIMLDTPFALEHKLTFPVLDILDRKSRDPKLMRTIRQNFLGTNISEGHQDLINGFQWYLLLNGYWNETMNTGVVLYKYLLRTNGLAAARELARTVNFSTISHIKTFTILGRALDISQSQPPSDNEENEAYDLRRSTRTRSVQVRTRRSSSSRRRSLAQRDVLLSHSQTFRDFESLMAALDALEFWKDIEAQAAQQADPRHARTWKTEMQDAYNAVVATVRPLLYDWLQYPKNDAEAAEFESLRTGYLPEIIIAYNSVLKFGGHSLSREILLKCMDLAAVVASQPALSDSFVRAGRMSELVDSMAIASKSILHAEQAGRKPNKKGKKLNGESMEIWSIKVPREAPEMQLPA